MGLHPRSKLRGFSWAACAVRWTVGKIRRPPHPSACSIMQCSVRFLGCVYLSPYNYTNIQPQSHAPQTRINAASVNPLYKSGIRMIPPDENHGPPLSAPALLFSKDLNQSSDLTSLPWTFSLSSSRTVGAQCVGWRAVSALRLLKGPRRALRLPRVYRLLLLLS